MFTDLGFENVRTVLASGNVVFETRRTGRAKLKSDIEAALRETFGYDAWIVLLDTDTVARIVEAYPFEEREGYQPYVLMASDPASLDDLMTLQGRPRRRCRADRTRRRGAVLGGRTRPDPAQLVRQGDG